MARDEPDRELDDMDKRALSLIYEWAVDQQYEPVIDALIAENPGIDQWHRTGAHANDLRDRERLFALTAMTEEEFYQEDTARILKASAIQRELSHGEVDCADFDLAMRTEHVLRVLRERGAEDNSIDWALATKAIATMFPKPDEPVQKRHAGSGHISPPVETEKVSCRRNKLQALIEAAAKGKTSEIDSFLALHPASALFGIYRQDIERTMRVWRARKPPCKLLQIVYNLEPLLCADEPAALAAAAAPAAAPAPALAAAAAAPAAAEPASAARGQLVVVAARSSPVRQVPAVAEAAPPAAPPAAPSLPAGGPIGALLPQPTRHGKRPAGSTPDGAQPEARATRAPAHVVSRTSDSLEDDVEDDISELEQAPQTQPPPRPHAPPQLVRSIPALQPSGRAGGVGVGVAMVIAGAAPISRKRKAFTDEETETLRKGFAQFKGQTQCWKLIKEWGGAVFKDRTTIDLKDKFRNMSKYETL